MIKLILNPYEGVGNIKIGMTKDEISTILNIIPETFEKSEGEFVGTAVGAGVESSQPPPPQGFLVASGVAVGTGDAVGTGAIPAPSLYTACIVALFEVSVIAASDDCSSDTVAPVTFQWSNVYPSASPALTFTG